MADASSTKRMTAGATRTVTVREAVIHLLRGWGCTTMFGNPGSTELPLFKDWPEDFRYVLGLQESVVVGMADAYALGTRNAAFVNLHSAAGTGHALGNLFGAWKNNAPVVVIAGQQARSMLLMEPFLGAQDAAELMLRLGCLPNEVIERFAAKKLTESNHGLEYRNMRS